MEDKTHKPNYLRNAVKENNIIQSTENRELTALSGSAGYGNAKPDFEVEIKSADVCDGSSLQLRGKLKVQGTINKPVKLCGSIASAVEQIVLDINGQSVLMLNQDGDYINYLHRALHSSFTQFSNDDVMTLAGVDLDVDEEHSFVIDLTKFGSALEYYLLTSPVITMKLKIRFQSDVARLFYNTDETATGAVSGYVLDNVRLTANFSNFHTDAKNAMIKRYQSPTGVKMVTHSYVPQRNQLVPLGTNHRIQGSYQYRNLVSTYYLPVPTSILAADKRNGVSKTDIVANVNFTGGQLPKNMRVRMDGMNFVNQNGNSGCTNKMEHLTGILKSAMRTPEESDIGYNICQGYKSGSYQPTGVSFVRGNDNLKDITNSGVNGFFSRGALETEFETSEAQTNKTLLTVGVVTTTVSIENGQVQVIR